MKETFILSKKQQKFINEDHLNENVEETQQRAVIRTDDSDIFDIWPPEKPIPYVIDKSIGDGKGTKNLELQVEMKRN